MCKGTPPATTHNPITLASESESGVSGVAAYQLLCCADQAGPSGEVISILPLDCYPQLVQLCQQRVVGLLGGLCMQQATRVEVRLCEHSSKLMLISGWREHRLQP